MKPLSHNAMRTIVRCAIFAPALAFGLPSIHGEDQPKPTAAPATPPRKDPSPTPTSPPTAKSIPPFLAQPKPASPADSPHPAPAVSTGISPADPAKKPPTNPEFSSSIRHSFPYVASAEATADAAQADETLPVIDMKPFHVATSRITDRVTKGLEERRQQELEKRFSLKNGGRFGKIGPAEIELKFDPKHKGWDLLNIPW
jgi:hypothetical protein